MRTRPFRLTILALAAAALLAPAGAAATEPSALLRWYGDTSSATGNALGQGSCDVNGDGYDDVVVGAWFWDKAPTSNTGAAYVIFGGPQVEGGDLNVPSAAGAARIDGPPVANSFVGFSVGCVGDVNGDGHGDIGISHYTAEKAYVVLGAEEFGNPDLSLLGERGFTIEGLDDGAHAYNVGNTLSAAGDVNGDGLDDVAVGGVVADTRGRTNNGRIWIVAGKDDVADVELIDPETGEAPADGEILATLDGPGDEDRLGQGGLAPAGDVNGDGVEDFVTGAYAATPWGSGVAVPGQAWVVWGDETWGAGGAPTAIDMAVIGAAGFEVMGPKRQRDRLGVSVSGAGDVNGDGKDDVIVGGDGVFNAATGQRPGSAWVIFGSASGERVYTETDPGATAAVYSCAGDDGSGTCAAADTIPRGYWIQGADSDPGAGSESTGFSLDGLGDISGDGVPDFAIGAYGYDPVNPANPPATMSGAGAVWVVYGKATTSTQDLAALTPTGGYRIDGLAAGDRFGRAVAALGDVDANGRADFAAAGDLAQRPLPPGTPRSQAGEVAVALLGPEASAIALTTTAAGALDPGQPFELTASVAGRRTGAVPADGTVTFSDGGDPLPGCEGIGLASGEASCAAVLTEAGEHELVASYSGGAGVGAGSSAPLSHLVKAPPAALPPGIEPRGKRAKLRRGAKAILPVSLSCAAPAGCRVAVEFARLRTGGRGFAVRAIAPVTFAPGSAPAIRVRLPKAARLALAEAGVGKLRIRLTVADGARTTSRTLAFSLRAR